MSFTSLLTQTATIHRRTLSGTPDDYNQPTWGETTTVVAAYVEQLGETEVGPQSLGTHRGFFDPDVDLDAKDLVTVAGITYEVVGIPDVAWNPRTGATHHTQASLVEVQD